MEKQEVANGESADMSGSGASRTVAILCRDPVVARIVGNLLQTVGYEARPADGIPPQEMSGVSLLFIAPGANPASDLADGLSPFEAHGVPTLDFADSSWPCRIEEMKDSIETALSEAVAELASDIAAPEPGIETI